MKNVLPGNEFQMSKICETRVTHFTGQNVVSNILLLLQIGNRDKYKIHVMDVCRDQTTLPNLIDKSALKILCFVKDSLSVRYNLQRF